VFAETDIDGFMALDIELLQCKLFGSIWPLAANNCRGMLSLCISDTAKQMLLNHSSFTSHLVNGLLLDPAHARKDSDEAVKAAVQRDFAECIQQISLFPPGCEALLATAGAVEALDALVELAWSEEAKDCARGALMQLTGRHPEPVGGGIAALHIMVSCECAPVPSCPPSAQPTRLHCRPMGCPGGHPEDREGPSAPHVLSVVRP
jgi:hypothetical protein